MRPAAALLLAAHLACASASAVEVAAPVPAGDVSVTASSTWGGLSPDAAANGSGLGEDGLHDNNGQAATGWHTAADAPASAPAPGLPVASAWLRFDFKRPTALGRCLIWNHNQANLTDRGFRHAQLFISTDGKAWQAVKVGGQDVFEIPRAPGTPAEPVSLSVALPGTPVKSAILLAKDNHGGNIHGLSEVRFLAPAKDVPAAELPVPGEPKAGAFPFIADDHDGWIRQIALDLDAPLYEAVEATVTCAGRSRTTRLDARPQGRTRLVLPLPDGSGAKRSSGDKVEVALACGAWKKRIETAIVPPTEYPDLEEVIVTWKCHLDIGFTHTVQEVVEKYRGRDMDQLLAMFERTRDKPEADRFRWMLPAWAADLVLDDRQTPERRAKLEQAVKDGRLLWHAIPYTFESDAADLEELVRGFSYGNRLSRRFNQPLVADAKQTDMPEQAWVMPTVLAHAGVKFLHIGANDGSKPYAEINKIPVLSWWEGADGSRILLGYSAHYGWGGVLPPRGWKHKAWLAFFVRPDNGGPPSPQEVENILAQGRKALPGVKIRFGRPSDFADAISAEEKAKPTLPVIRADMPDTWCHGQMSCPVATGIHRQAAPLLGTLGSLDTTLGAFGVQTDPVAPLLADGYKNGGFYAEHTWGIDGKKFSGLYGEQWRKKFDAGGYKHFEDTYAYHMDYGRKAMQAAQDGLAPRVKALAEAVKADGPRVVVFNPLPWQRDAEVEVAAPDLKAGIWFANDRSSPWAPEAVFKDGKLRFLAKAVPPGGYKTFVLSPGAGCGVKDGGQATVADGGVVKTPFFTATFDLGKGGLSSLIETATGRELVAQDQGGHALGQFLHERFDEAHVLKFIHAYNRLEAGGWVLGDFGKPNLGHVKGLTYAGLTPKGWTATMANDDLSVRVTLRPADTLGLAKGHELVFTFPKGQACVDIGWKVDGKTPDPIPEGGWLCLPFKVENPAFRIGRVGGTIDPAKDISFGANRSLITVDRGITVRQGEAGAGVGVASADLPLWSLGKPGLWTYEPAYVPTRPELFVNLYNNMWGTNYPQWIGGSWSASLRLWPVAAGATEEQAHFTPAWELRQGVVAAFADGKPGALPVSQAGLALSKKGVRVTAFCPNPDGAGTVLRLWEQAGASGKVEVSLPAGFKATKAQPVTLRGVPAGTAVKVEDGRFTLDLGAWAPASFVLE